MIQTTLIQRLARARLVVAFTGAGVSAESGVATFRAQGGLWTKFSPQELANVNAFMANPQMVWEWYQARRDVVLNAKPNPGHIALAELQSLVPKVAVVTQNIDGLHQMAGSQDVVQLHGDIRKNFCIKCGTRYDAPEFLTVREVQQCECGGNIRPDIVWFGEMLPADQWKRAEFLARQADLMFSIGTSSQVYPAAGIPLLAKEHGAYLVEINPEETPNSGYADEVIRATGGTALPDIVNALRSFQNS